MGLDLSKVGAKSAVSTHRYNWRDQACYALGIGAKRDELVHLYERVEGGMQVFPTYAVVPAFEPVFELIDLADVDLSMVVHGAQKIVAHRAAPAEAEVETQAELVGMYDLKRFAQLDIATHTTLDGEPLFDTVWSIIVRDGGRFGGPRPPKVDAPKLPKDQDPTWVMKETTSPEQALLYRLSGDINPLHADPAFAARVGFEEGPILHGLCTYGHVARAVVKHAAGGDARRLKSLFAQFRKPVWPGDTIVTSGYDLGDGKIGLKAMVEGRPDPVVANAWAQVEAEA